jgi:hypothetical protein
MMMATTPVNQTIDCLSRIDVRIQQRQRCSFVVLELLLMLAAVVLQRQILSNRMQLWSYHLRFENVPYCWQFEASIEHSDDGYEGPKAGRGGSSC